MYSSPLKQTRYSVLETFCTYAGLTIGTRRVEPDCVEFTLEYPIPQAYQNYYKVRCVRLSGDQYVIFGITATPLDDGVPNAVVLAHYVY